MARKKDSLASAQVVFQGAGGALPEGGAPITTANFRDFVPNGGAIAEVVDAFHRLSFSTGPLVGNNFSITGPISLFERVFGAPLRRSGREQIMRKGIQGPKAYELPLSKLPTTVRRHLAAVTFTPPPDFGPGNFGF
jgi:hypothetical protein